MGRRKYTRKEIQKAEKLLGISTAIFVGIGIITYILDICDVLASYYGDGPIISFILEYFGFMAKLMFVAPVILYVIGLIFGAIIGIDIGPKNRK